MRHAYTFTTLHPQARRACTHTHTHDPPINHVQTDRLVKVWWQQEVDKSGVGISEGQGGAGKRWTFVYLPHPRSVTGMQWREQSVMSAKRFSNAMVLMTSCRDGVTRIWTGIGGWAKDLLHFHLAASIPSPDPPQTADSKASASDSISVGSAHTLGSMTHSYEGHYIHSVPIVLIPGREMCMSVTLKESVQEKGMPLWL